MQYYPLLFQLESRRCLVVGGGRVALRRCKALLSAGARVDVIATEVSDELRALLRDGNGELVEQAYADALVSHHASHITRLSERRTSWQRRQRAS